MTPKRIKGISGSCITVPSRTTKESSFDVAKKSGSCSIWHFPEHGSRRASRRYHTVFPARSYTLQQPVVRIKKISRQIAKELNISGPFTQFLPEITRSRLSSVILRAFCHSRLFPRCSNNFIETTRIMLDAPYSRTRQIGI